MTHRIPIPDQDRRRAELFALRSHRRLTDAELLEEQRLEAALYMRGYRKQLREDEQRLARIA